MKTKFLIIGSGIGGLATGAELKNRGEEDFLIIDKTPSLPRNFSNGLHYLHSIPKLPFEMEFKTIPLTEQLWDTRTNTFTKQASLPEMFEYSKKIMENLRHKSSITDPGLRNEVYVPDSNSMDDILDKLHDYIGKDKFSWSQNVKTIDSASKIVHSENEQIKYKHLITTAPLNKIYEQCGLVCPYALKHKPLNITNYKTTNIVPNWLIVMYMSDPKFPPYRITVFNNILSMESLTKLTYEDEVVIKYLIGDLFDYELTSKSEYLWETGRIFGLQPHDRAKIIDEFAKQNIYLVGRFSNWNGKLLIDSTINQGQQLIKTIYDI